MNNRYFIDERVGCIAVLDRTKANCNTPGLNRDTSGVVRFWNGIYQDDEWHVPEQYWRLANDLCAKLNREEDEFNA